MDLDVNTGLVFFRVWIFGFGFSLVLDVVVFIGIRYVARLSDVKV